MKGKGRWIVLALALVVAGRFVLRWLDARPPRDGAAPVVTERVARVVPEGVRIRVEVLNGTGIRGLARRGTTAMRDAGFDVVATGNHDTRVDSSLVIVRTGNAEWAAWAAKALGGARIESRPDTSRYVDLTLVLGARWRPPAQPFDP